MPFGIGALLVAEPEACPGSLFVVLEGEGEGFVGRERAFDDCIEGRLIVMGRCALEATAAAIANYGGLHEVLSSSHIVRHERRENQR